MKCLVVSTLLLMCYSSSAQKSGGSNNLNLLLSLSDVISTAHDQSPAALLARHTFLTGYWEYRAFQAEQLPSLRLSGSLGQYNRSLVALQDATTGAYNYVGNNTLNNSLALSLPILDWGVGKGRVKVAQSQAEVVEAQISQALSSLRENVALKVMQFNRQGGQCAVSRKAEVVGRDRYTAARERFLAGATSVTELNNAQSEMENASIRYLQDLASWWQYYYAIRQMTFYDYQKQFRIDETTYEEIPAAGSRAAAL